LTRRLRLVTSDAPNAQARPRCPPSRIVVAEDDTHLRHAVVDVLRRQGYEVMEAADSTQLLAELVLHDLRNRGRTEGVDLILTDVRMPGCSGLALMELLREAEWRRPMILMTAFADQDTRARARAIGAVMLDKPFRIEELLATVRTSLR
jgi:DNA-binding response OmpR family regulator